MSLLLWIAAVSGCTHPTGGGPAATLQAGAEIIVTNESHRQWSLVFQRSVPEPTRRALLLAPLASERLRLEAGSYDVSQALLDLDGQIISERRFREEFASGETYHWPLTTLQAAPLDLKP